MHPTCRVGVVVRNALKRGIKLIVVAGGDGTIELAAANLLGSDAVLGIIPIGTRNNLAYNLGIPKAIPASVSLLREGHKVKMDVGHIRSGRSNRWFLEAASLGLITDLYPAADSLQHGALFQLGNLLSTLVTAAQAQLRITLDRTRKIEATAHTILIANVPFVGPHLLIAPKVSMSDGYLDLFVFSDMGKIGLLNFAVHTLEASVKDPRIKHYRVKHLKIESDPLMPVLADSFLLEQGRVEVQVHPRSLTVIGGYRSGAKSERLMSEIPSQQN